MTFELRAPGTLIRFHAGEQLVTRVASLFPTPLELFRSVSPPAGRVPGLCREPQLVRIPSSIC
jgi:hypothetical protein